MTKLSWNDSYPPLPERPSRQQWPAWYHVPIDDLVLWLGSTGIDLARVKSVLDIGGGDGRRVMNAFLKTPVLNRRDVHVVMIDNASNAIAWAIDLWSRVRMGQVIDDLPVPPSGQATWSMTLREEDALCLPDDLLRTRFDLVIDWMFLHGLSIADARTYLAAIKRMAPEYFVLKCFSKEGSSMDRLPRAVHDVEKRQWSQDELLEILGDTFELKCEPLQCNEDLRPLHPDGPIGAKRQYCFVRR